MKRIFQYVLIAFVTTQIISCSYDDKTKPGYEYMPDMYRSPSYETYSANPLFSDSMTARQPVAGTIARGDEIYTDYDRLPYPYPNTNEGYGEAGAKLTNPIPNTTENMAEGKRLYENYCTHCHGATGQGDGLVVSHNGPKPPAYNSDALKNLPVGKMFHTTQWGKNMMGSHASQLTPTQRWKIIWYVQTLQHAGGQTATADSTAEKPKAGKTEKNVIRHDKMDRKYELTKNNKMYTMVMMAIGVVAVVMGFMDNSTRAWAVLLQNNFYFMALSLCGTFFMAFNYAAQAGWSVGIKRIPEAVGGFLKFGMLGMILIFIFGHHDLYHWTHPEQYVKGGPEYDDIMAGKSGFLNIPFFVVRLIAYSAIWVGFTYMLRKHSLQEDQEGGVMHYKKSVTLSAVFLVLFAITSSTSAWDFLMSIDSHWFSTLFGWYTFIGLFVSGMAMICLLLLYLRRRGYMEHLTENHFHDVGKFMFAFSIFWTYLWFSQFMLIWYANLPEEVVYFQVRWMYMRTLWAANLLINFCAPFLVLMTRDAKRRYTILFIGCLIILCGHWLDVFVMVMPGTVGANWHIGFVEIGTAIGYLGLFLYVVLNELTKAALVPKNHPMLAESLHHHI